MKVSNTGYKKNSKDKNQASLLIPSNRITMKNVEFPVYGVDNMGYSQMMYPGLDYSFPGNYVYEFPMAKEGGNILPGRYKNPEGNWLDKYQSKTTQGDIKNAGPRIDKMPISTVDDKLDIAYDGTYVYVRKKGEQSWKTLDANKSKEFVNKYQGHIPPTLTHVENQKKKQEAYNAKVAAEKKEREELLKYTPLKLTKEVKDRVVQESKNERAKLAEKSWFDSAWDTAKGAYEALPDISDVTNAIKGAYYTFSPTGLAIDFVKAHRDEIENKGLEALQKTSKFIGEAYDAATNNEEHDSFFSNLAPQIQYYREKKYGTTAPSESQFQIFEDTTSTQNVIPAISDTTSTAPEEKTFSFDPKKVDLIAIDSDIDYGRENTKFWSFRRTSDNDTGFTYVPTPRKAKMGKNNEKGVSNVLGMAHFLIESDLTDGYQSDATKSSIERSIKENKYIPVYKKNYDTGDVNVYYVKGEEKPKEGYNYASNLRQYKLSEIDWNRSKHPAGYGSGTSNILTKDGRDTFLIFKNANINKDGVHTKIGRNNGNDVVFIIEKNGKRYLRDFAGTITQIKQEAQNIKKEFGVSEDDITLGFYDQGSYNSKPKARDENNFIPYSDYNTFHNDSRTGAGLAVPAYAYGGSTLSKLPYKKYGGALNKYKKMNKYQSDVNGSEVIYVDDPNDPRLKDYQTRMNLYRYSQIPNYWLRDSIYDINTILSGDYNTQDILKDYNDSPLELIQRTTNELLGPYGSAAEKVDIPKNKLRSFVNDPRLRWSADLAYPWSYSESQINDSDDPDAELVRQTMKNYPPDSYQGMITYTTYPFTTRTAHIPNAPYGSRNYWTSPKTQFIEDEINRDAIRQVYPLLNDEKIDEFVTRFREIPHYTTNVFNPNTGNYFLTSGRDNANLPEWFDPKEDNAMPVVDGIFPGSYPVKLNRGQLKTRGYLDENIIENIFKQGEYFPVWNKPTNSVYYKITPKDPGLLPSISPGLKKSTTTLIPDKKIIQAKNTEYDRNTRMYSKAVQAQSPGLGTHEYAREVRIGNDMYPVTHSNDKPYGEFEINGKKQYITYRKNEPEAGGGYTPIISETEPPRPKVIKAPTFQKGGWLDQYQGDKQPSQVEPYEVEPTRADSLELLNNAIQVLDYYKSKNYNEIDKPLYFDEPAKQNIFGVLESVRETYDPNVVRRTPTGKQAVPLNEYYKPVDKNKFYQREYAQAAFDTRAPMQLFDRRILPTAQYSYQNTRKNDPLYGDRVGIYGYDPISITPWDMLTDEQKKLRVKTFGRSGVPENYDPEKPELTYLKPFERPELKLDIGKPSVKSQGIRIRPMMTADQTTHTGQYQSGKYIWNPETKSWKVQILSPEAQQDNKEEVRIKIKKNGGWLDRYQGDTTPSQVNKPLTVTQDPEFGSMLPEVEVVGEKPQWVKDDEYMRRIRLNDPSRYDGPLKSVPFFEGLLMAPVAAGTLSTLMGANLFGSGVTLGNIANPYFAYKGTESILDSDSDFRQALKKYNSGEENDWRELAGESLLTGLSLSGALTLPRDAKAIGQFVSKAPGVRNVAKLYQPAYMSTEAPKGNMYGENQVLIQRARLLDPEIKAKFFKQQAAPSEVQPSFSKLGKMPKNINNEITPENYEAFVNRIHGSTDYDLAGTFGKRPSNLGSGNYGKVGAVFKDAPLNKLGKDIINAHEKNHGIFAGQLSREMTEDLLKPFGPGKVLSGYKQRHQADEVLGRMAQFKNALGIGNNQTFTLGHLNLIRKNYAKRFLDNGITEMLSKLKPGSAEEREFLKNMNKYAFGIGLPTALSIKLFQDSEPKVIKAPTFKSGGWLDSYQEGKEVNKPLTVTRDPEFGTMLPEVEIVDKKPEYVQFRPPLPSGAITSVPFFEAALMAPTALATLTPWLSAPATIGSTVYPSITLGNVLGAAGAGISTNEFFNPDSYTRASVNRAYENPTTDNIINAVGDVGLAGLGYFGIGIGKGIRQGVKNAGNYLTTQTPKSGLLTDSFRELYAGFNPKNLQTESAVDWMKSWYKDPDFLRRYGDEGRFSPETAQFFILDALNKYQPKNYINLLKDKGLRTYLNKSIDTGGVSYGVPESIYVNRTMQLPFNKKGLESVRAHELTHLIENNGYYLSVDDERRLLAPFGYSHVDQIPKKRNPRYYLDPSEIHARMNQARFDLGLTPKDQFTEKMFDQISKRYGWYGMGKYIKNKQGFIDLMNKFWAATPYAIATSAAGKALYDSEKPVKKYGGWLDKYQSDTTQGQTRRDPNIPFYQSETEPDMYESQYSQPEVTITPNWTEAELERNRLRDEYIEKDKKVWRHWYDKLGYDKNNVTKRATQHAYNKLAKQYLKGDREKLTPEQIKFIQKSEYANRLQPSVGSRFVEGVTNPGFNLRTVGNLLAPFEYPSNLVRGAVKGEFADAVKGQTPSPYFVSSDLPGTSPTEAAIASGLMTVATDPLFLTGDEIFRGIGQGASALRRGTGKYFNTASDILPTSPLPTQPSKSLQEITNDIDALNSTIKPRSEATTDDMQEILEKLQGINRSLEEHIDPSEISAIDDLLKDMDMSFDPSITGNLDDMKGGIDPDIFKSMKDKLKGIEKNEEALRQQELDDLAKQVPEEFGIEARAAGAKGAKFPGYYTDAELQANLQAYNEYMTARKKFSEGYNTPLLPEELEKEFELLFPNVKLPTWNKELTTKQANELMIKNPALYREFFGSTGNKLTSQNLKKHGDDLTTGGLWNHKLNSVTPAQRSYDEILKLADDPNAWYIRDPKEYLTEMLPMFNYELSLKGINTKNINLEALSQEQLSALAEQVNQLFIENLDRMRKTIPGGSWQNQPKGSIQIPFRPEQMNKYGGSPNWLDKYQDGREVKEMPFGLPLREQNPYLVPEYYQPMANGYILPDPNRPELMNTGATEYKYSYGVDNGEIQIPSVVSGQYIGDNALARYIMSGEEFKPMADPAAYSKFYDMISQLGLMKQKKGGEPYPSLGYFNYIGGYRGMLP
jgi:hypothetical protein